jgi:hypothetical protein
MTLMRPPRLIWRHGTATLSYLMRSQVPEGKELLRPEVGFVVKTHKLLKAMMRSAKLVSASCNRDTRCDASSARPCIGINIISCVGRCRRARS